MSVISFAVIGKNRQPIFIKEFKNISPTDDDDDIDDMQLFGITTTTRTTTAAATVPNKETTTTSGTGSSPNDENRDYNCSIRQQFILHDALDYMEQWIEQMSNSSNCNSITGSSTQLPTTAAAVAQQHDAMFAGLLCPIEDMRTYGYMTTTQIIFLLVVQDDATLMMDQRLIDGMIQRLFVQLHRCYVEYILNPFSPIVDTAAITTKLIDSKQFQARVQNCIETFNHQLLIR